MNQSLRRWHYGLLWLLVLLLIVSNGVLIWNLLQARQTAVFALQNLAAELEQTQLDDFEIMVNVDQTLPISLTVPFADTFTVPINSSVVVDTTVLFEDNIEVPINTVIPIERDFAVEVQIPAIGAVSIPIPIRTSVPVNLTVDVPIRREIPVQTEIPVNLTVDVPVETAVSIDTTVPIQLQIPVTVPLSDLPLQDMLDSLADSATRMALELE